MKQAGASGAAHAACHDAEAETLALRLPLTERGGSVEGRSPAALGAAAFFVTLAVAMALAPVGIAIRAACALVLVAIAGVLARRGAQRISPARGWIVGDAAGLSRVELGAVRQLVRWDEAFGVTVLTVAGRARAILAFTTPAQTRYVAVTIGDVEDRAAATALLARAVVVPATEIAPALGDSGVALSGSDAARLVAAVARRAPGALDRMYLTGARGEPIVLEAGVLRIGAGTIDLAAPLEWRGFMFHESAGRVAAFYQATWMRQLDVEAVLVAPMPAEASQARDVRELRVVQSLPGDPPARELRVAIERLFMLPLRHALDRAPRISHVPSAPPLPTRPSRPEGRVP